MGCCEIFLATADDLPVRVIYKRPARDRIDITEIWVAMEGGKCYNVKAALAENVVSGLQADILSQQRDAA